MSMPASLRDLHPLLKRGLARCAALTALAWLGGCQSPSPWPIDNEHQSSNQDSRVLFLVLHYTVGDADSALRTLTQPSAAPVSSHYLVTESPVRIYRLVDENRRAWHAGPSYWRGHSPLNASSIGIEIVNTSGTRAADGSIEFKPYPPAQIDAVIALCRDIVARHGIRPERIVGHSDIQPQSKFDPGPLFPWRRLADAGLIAWPDPAKVAARRAQYSLQLPDAAWFQGQLAQVGFAPNASGQWDATTRDALRAFQMRWRPARYDGQADAETAALLATVNDPDAMLLQGRLPSAAPPASPLPARW